MYGNDKFFFIWKERNIYSGKRATTGGKQEITRAGQAVACPALTQIAVA